MVSRILHTLGADLGGAENQLNSNDDNPEGYWENWNIVEINDEIFELFGGTWDSPPSFPSDWQFDERLSALKLRATGVFSRFEGNRQWSFKDPRLMLTLPFWQTVLPEMRYLLCVRNPYEVAESFAKRAVDGLPFYQALELWETYHERLAEAIDFNKCIVSNNLSFVTSPVKEIERLLPLFVSPPSTELVAEAAATVKPSLFRNIAPESAIEQPYVRRPIQQMYWALTELCGPQYRTGASDPLLQLKASENTISRLNAIRLERERELDACRHQLHLASQDNFSRTGSASHAASNIVRLAEREVLTIQQLETAVEELRLAVQAEEERVREIQSREDHIVHRVWDAIAEKNLVVEELNRVKSHRDSVLEAHETIQRSISWRLGCKVVNTLARLAPPGSAQRRLGAKLLGRDRGEVQSGEAALERAPDTRGLNVPFSASPDVSLVIPVHNQWFHTSRCLLSLSKNLPKSLKVETIVVNDGSRDSTVAELDQINGVTVVTNDIAEGFIRACNKGAATAKGKYVLFLNNDTEVHAGFLEPLFELAERDETVAVVGSKLIYPDGTLQEAGGIIYRDGTGANFGRNGDPADPRYNYVRDVDYCSGASILVRRSFFEKVGGFDEHYLPAYCEDADLCMKARQMGLRVVYQPKSVVTHFEGASSGRDLSTGIKAYQVANQQKLAKRWEQELREHHESVGNTLLYRASRRLAGKPTVLVLDYQLPYFDQDSGSLRMFRLLKIMREMNLGVLFACIHGERPEKYVDALESIGVEVVTGLGSESHDRLPFLMRLDTMDAAFVSRPDVMEEFLPDLWRYKTPRILYDTVDLHYVRFRRETALGIRQDDGSWQRMMERELRYCRVADLTLTVTEDEATELRAQGIPNVSVLPNIQPEPMEDVPSFDSRSGLLFIGGYRHPPNIDAVKWLVNDIMPIIWRRIPNMKLTLLGSHPPEDVLALRSDLVEVPGFKESVDEEFLTHRIFVCPLRYGAGMKGKITQSLSFRLPTVTTSIGAEGMKLVDHEHAMIADSAEGFADAVLRLYEDPVLWNKLSNNAAEPLKFQSPERVRTVLNQALFGNEGLT